MQPTALTWHFFCYPSFSWAAQGREKPHATNLGHCEEFGSFFLSIAISLLRGGELLGSVLTLRRGRHELHPSACRIPHQQPGTKFLVEVHENWSPSSCFCLSVSSSNLPARCCQQPITQPSPVMGSSTFRAWSASLLPDSSLSQDLNLLIYFLSY